MVAVALVGCMRIYPDPELPDIEVEWFEDDCRPGTGDLALTLVGVDDATLRVDVTVPCASLGATFEDMPRERYLLDASLLTTGGGAVFIRARAEIDLRNGLDERTQLYLGGFANFRVAWSFDAGASCASLGIDDVIAELTPASFGGIGMGAPCDLPPILNYAPSGNYTLVLRGLDQGVTVAVSSPVTDVVIDDAGFTDLGTVVLSPCGASCP